MSTPADDYTELAELAGGFIHEIKNHISTLGLNLQLLGEDFAQPETPRERRALQRIHRLQGECQRLVEISNDFLRFSRASQLQLQPSRLDELVGEMVDFFTPTAKQAGILITWYPCGAAPLIQLDRELLKQTLLNLMINSQQAMPEGGELILQARVEPEWVCLDVIDTGEGIPPEKLDTIFRPFHTSKPGGTGLGLPTSRRIIEGHGGTLQVISDPGRGSKFTIRLPIPTEPIHGDSPS